MEQALTTSTTPPAGVLAAELRSAGKRTSGGLRPVSVYTAKLMYEQKTKTDTFFPNKKASLHLPEPWHRKSLKEVTITMQIRVIAVHL